VVTMLVCSIYFAREAAGVASTRLSLRPLISDGFTLTQNLRKSRGEIAEVWVRRP